MIEYRAIVHGPGGAGEREYVSLQERPVAPGDGITIPPIGACLVESVDGATLLAEYAVKFETPAGARHVIGAGDVAVIARLLPAGAADQPLPPGAAVRVLLEECLENPRTKDGVHTRDGDEHDALVAALQAWKVQGGMSDQAFALWADLTRG